MFDKKKELESEVFALNAKGLSNPNSSTISQSDSGVKIEQRAYSGSRVDYDRPSLEAIGSGEGVQAHGWG